MPTILAGALKRMLNLPVNVVTGVPRVEKDPRGGDVVIVPVRPYANDMDRCARLMLEYAPPRVTCADHGVTSRWCRGRDARARTRMISNGRRRGRACTRPEAP